MSIRVGTRTRLEVCSIVEAATQSSAMRACSSSTHQLKCHGLTTAQPRGASATEDTSHAYTHTHAHAHHPTQMRTDVQMNTRQYAHNHVILACPCACTSSSEAARIVQLKLVEQALHVVHYASRYLDALPEVM
mmetsp:Transcript_87326/g.174421  ORF Transcript_87326/g.174421 Transcript_87326/m.174421 type:complete len:133 (-) Transcript_87326:499-897(-)